MLKQWLLNKFTDDMRVFKNTYYLDEILISAYGEWWVGRIFTYKIKDPIDALNTDHKIINGLCNEEICYLTRFPFPLFWDNDTVIKKTICVKNKDQEKAFFDFFDKFQKKHLRPSKEDFQTLSTQLKLLSAEYG